MPQLTFFVFLMVCLPLFTSAQTTSTSSQINLNENNVQTTTTDPEWSFYSNDEARTYFIDFEKINVNLSDVIVKDEHGEILIKDNVYQLPVDTIYEVDFSPFGAGIYSIELRTFTGTIEQQINIK